MGTEKVLLSGETSPICCDAQQRSQLIGGRCWSRFCFSARWYWFRFWPCRYRVCNWAFSCNPAINHDFIVLTGSMVLCLCVEQKVTIVMLRLVSQNSLTFRLLSSPGGLSGSIILRYSSFESLCSDFPSRSAAWSLQAASCAYSCL